MDLKRRSKISTEFNMSSMTDIIFLLLIFFIITSTVVREPVMKILLPKGVKKNVVKQIVKLYVDQDLKYAVDDKKVTFENLPNVLQGVLKDNPGATVSVHADKSIPYEKVMELVFIADKMEAKVVLALDSDK